MLLRQSYEKSINYTQSLHSLPLYLDFLHNQKRNCIIYDTLQTSKYYKSEIFICLDKNKITNSKHAKLYWLLPWNEDKRNCWIEIDTKTNVKKF